MKPRQKSKKLCLKSYALLAKDANLRLSFQNFYGWYSLWNLQQEILSRCSKSLIFSICYMELRVRSQRLVMFLAKYCLDCTKRRIFWLMACGDAFQGLISPPAINSLVVRLQSSSVKLRATLFNGPWFRRRGQLLRKTSKKLDWGTRTIWLRRTWSELIFLKTIWVVFLMAKKINNLQI